MRTFLRIVSSSCASLALAIAALSMGPSGDANAAAGVAKPTCFGSCGCVYTQQYGWICAGVTGCATNCVCDLNSGFCYAF